MDRRSFLATGATARSASAHRSAGASPPSRRRRRRRRARSTQLFEDIFQERVRTSPELATSLGLDKGAERRAQVEARHPARPPVARREDLARNRRAIAAAARRSPRDACRDAAKLNREVVIYSLETQTSAPSRWDIDSAQRPYPIFQQGGAYFSTPDFLNTAHTIDNAADAEAYLSRLDAIRDRRSTTTPPSSARRRRAASSRRPGRST